ncbi:MAG: hypothetical protein PUP90_13835 [Nostoc sp. S4]|nr:hypothetical protein [Nostoc sp. S4]
MGQCQGVALTAVGIAIAPVPQDGSDTVLRCDDLRSVVDHRLLQEVKYS